MKIAQVAPLAERCPPRLYGGTERIVSYLTEELVRQGHDVTLFASGHSRTSAKLVRCSDMALRLNPAVKDHVPYHLVMLDEVRRRAEQFDVIHFHIEHLHLPVFAGSGVPYLTTMHGRLDLPELQPLYRGFPDVFFVSISDAQRAPFADVRWAATVAHGLPHDLYRFRDRPGRHLVFLGRISPEKGPICAASRSPAAHSRRMRPPSRANGRG